MKRKANPFCEAISRRQYEAATWGAANVGCANRGVEQVDGRWVCRVHSDPDKRYGFNDRRVKKTKEAQHDASR